MSGMTEIERLVAIEDIKLLRARYCRAIDTKDWTLLRSLIADDIRLDLPSLRDRGGVRGTDEFMDLVQGWFAQSPSLHANHLPEIVIESVTRASGIWAQEHFLPQHYEPGARHGHGYGYSHDEYAKIDGSWRVIGVRLEPLFEII